MQSAPIENSLSLQEHQPIL